MILNVNKEEGFFFWGGQKEIEKGDINKIKEETFTNMKSHNDCSRR